jgi:hypothetical protein
VSLAPLGNALYRGDAEAVENAQGNFRLALKECSIISPIVVVFEMPTYQIAQLKKLLCAFSASPRLRVEKIFA